MNALISGQAGYALLVEGNDVELLDVTLPSKKRHCAPSSIPYLLAGATDVQELQNTSPQEAMAELCRAYDCDRALHLTLILLDPEEDANNRMLAAEYAQNLVRQGHAKDFVQNRLYTAQLPRAVDIPGALQLLDDSRSPLKSILLEICGRQDAIGRVQDAFQAIPIGVFGGPEERQRFEAGAKRTEAARLLASNAVPVHGALLMEVLTELRHVPNARSVVLEWAKLLGIAKNERPALVPDAAEEVLGEEQPRRPRSVPGRGHAAFQNALQQKKAIKGAVSRGDTNLARKFAHELVRFQTRDGKDPSFASMSLCDLAQHAKAYCDHSLQLEFAELAVQICPEDGRAHCHLADAFVCLCRLDDARRSFENARAFGEEAYAVNGFARILRLQGKHREALAAFEEATRRFPDNIHSWLSRAEVLRETWRLEEAKAAYDDALERFPQDVIALNGRATVYKELGLLDQALSEYEIAMQLDADDPYARNGRAQVLLEMGKLDAALAAYNRSVERCPGDSVAWSGAAETLLVLERAEAALEMYSDACRRFPHLSAPVSGHASALVELHRFREAEQAYAVALQRFPDDLFIRNGYATFLEKCGRLEESLQAYEATARAYPFDMIAKSACADLLKRLGKIDDADHAYSELMKINPRDKRVRCARAAVLVAKGDLAGAEQLLPVGNPTALQDWVGLHVRAMLLVRRGDLTEAEKLLRYAVGACPWYRERPYFEGALALVLLLRQRAGDAAAALGQSHGTIASIFRLHAFGDLGQREQAARAYYDVRDRCPPLLVALRDELASRYVLGQRGRHADDWVFEEESRMVLLRAA